MNASKVPALWSKRVLQQLENAVQWVDRQFHPRKFFGALWKNQDGSPQLVPPYARVTSDGVQVSD